MNGPFEHLLQHVKVLEAQVERDADLDRRLEELAARLELRIAEAPEELEARLGLLEQRVEERFDELRGILHRMESKIDALALSLNGDHHSDGATRSSGTSELTMRFPTPR